LIGSYITSPVLPFFCSFTFLWSRVGIYDYLFILSFADFLASFSACAASIVWLSIQNLFVDKENVCFE
ncbi:hypothetical protein, partial [Aneurinibacillus thermoaerophilus]|uniref:hypothetical protein n=1 Tax=Aneurinibacillus thermoaerophilus TaxID=143495 RepID=UPI002E1E36D6|nr:hypothetical protein [Aneurinibacillus thermoaerophilus]MED0758814.1 hypothetical protein [Aneurinibacillus thermoaerophilus]